MLMKCARNTTNKPGYPKSGVAAEDDTISAVSAEGMEDTGAYSRSDEIVSRCEGPHISAAGR
jgi:hypothetical protein